VGLGGRADEVLQSEEARLEFDKEPGHDKLKVSCVDDLVVSLIWREGGLTSCVGGDGSVA
jgi:hypothetical protein